MKRAAVLDLETTGIDIHRDEIVQCAILKADLPDLAPGDLWECYARPRGAIPAEATAVHGITLGPVWNEEGRGSLVDVSECPHFSEQVDELTEVGADIDLLITFNGCAFDLPIIRRVTGIPFAGPHLDVYRVWQVARDRGLGCPVGPCPNSSTVCAMTGEVGIDPWCGPACALCQGFGRGVQPSAKRYTGALGSSWAWLTGQEPSGEHDAGQDCRMTLDVARVLVHAYGLEQCIAWTTGPLPGCVDWAGKFKWNRAGQVVFTFSKHKGVTLDAISKSQRGFLLWMLREDFHEDTKKIVRGALDGRLPTR